MIVLEQILVQEYVSTEDKEKETETLANLNLKLLLNIISHEKSVQ